MATGRHTHNTGKYSAFTIFKKVQFRLDALLAMDQSPSPAGPGPVHFLRAWARNFEKGPGLSQAPTQL